MQCAAARNNEEGSIYTTSYSADSSKHVASDKPLRNMLLFWHKMAQTVDIEDPQ
jgi:pyridoxine/pyridoxamine 5'-phosphate oxidase